MAAVASDLRLFAARILAGLAAVFLSRRCHTGTRDMRTLLSCFGRHGIPPVGGVGCTLAIEGECRKSKIRFLVEKEVIVPGWPIAAPIHQVPAKRISILELLHATPPVL
jgi:hypothetical protein